MIKQILLRIRVDWKEYWMDKFDTWDRHRDQRRIQRAIAVAKDKNVFDGKTYYVLRDPRGFPAAYNNHDIKYLKRLGIIPKGISYEKLLESCIAVITSTEVTINHYVKIQNKKEEAV